MAGVEALTDEVRCTTLVAVTVSVTNLVVVVFFASELADDEDPTDEVRCTTLVAVTVSVTTSVVQIVDVTALTVLL
jgi:hypothetical protein